MIFDINRSSSKNWDLKLGRPVEETRDSKSPSPDPITDLVSPEGSGKKAQMYFMSGAL